MTTHKPLKLSAPEVSWHGRKLCYAEHQEPHIHRYIKICMTFWHLHYYLKERLILCITGDIRVSVIYNFSFKCMQFPWFSWIKLFNNITACFVTKVSWRHAMCCAFYVDCNKLANADLTFAWSSLFRHLCPVLLLLLLK